MTNASPLRRIGMFGGAFDPPHPAHVTLAQTAISQLQLDMLHVIPTGHAWHKAHNLTSAEHRLAMARLAFSELSPLEVDVREMKRSGPSFTVDTLRELHQENPDAQLYLVLGEDQAHALPTWQRWEELPNLAIICVAARADAAGVYGQFDALEALIPGLVRLKMPIAPISATEIRRSVANGHSVAPLVFDSVARYIEQHHLYQSV